MTLTIKLPPTYDHSTADECAIQMDEAAKALEQLIKAKVEYGLTTQAAADHKLHLYRSIAAALDAILSAMDERDTSASAAPINPESDAPIPPDAARPSTTQPGDTLCCVDCGCTSKAAQAIFINGLDSPFLSLRADYYACPKCNGIYIVKQEGQP